MSALQRVCAIVLAIFLPPLSVFLMRGCGKDLCINALLTLLMFLPGSIHAVWIALSHAKSGAPALPQ